MELNEISEEIDILLRNTNYTREVCIQKLEIHGNVEAVIKDYLGIRVEKPSAVSVNQGIYTSIRNFLDGNQDK